MSGITACASRQAQTIYLNGYTYFLNPTCVTYQAIDDRNIMCYDAKGNPTGGSYGLDSTQMAHLNNLNAADTAQPSFGSRLVKGLQAMGEGFQGTPQQQQQQQQEEIIRQNQQILNNQRRMEDEARMNKYRYPPML